MRTTKRGRGKHPVEELRKKIGKMWDAGATQREIADALQVPSSDVRYHLQKLGVPETLQHKAHPVVRGKRVCVQCRENKELTLYPSPRHAICLACLSKNRENKDA
jgi:predicted ArsR family transcriptional regulator